jgi:hypothetical protein
LKELPQRRPSAAILSFLGDGTKGEKKSRQDNLVKVQGNADIRQAGTAIVRLARRASKIVRFHKGAFHPLCRLI